MKSLYTFILLFLFQHNLFPQLAQSYFPSQTGFTWTYRVTPLDSLNNPMNQLTYYQIDSFAVTQNYFGRTANYVVSKSGPELTVPFQPYLDTSYISFQSNDAYKYYSLFNFDSLLGGIGNRTLSPGNIEAFEGWFPYYKFAQTANFTYQVFSKDTSLTFDTLTFPIRYELRGKRLSDQSVTTQLGTFNCKRFVLTTVLSYMLIPILPIPIYQIVDTTWIAQGNWIVKQVTPSSVVDLSMIGLITFYVPGMIRESRPPIVTGINEEENIVKEFQLFQNYPNPFNPTTKIKYAIPSAVSPLLGGAGGGYVTLKVYDILGNEVADLVNEHQPAGIYEVEFDASSGIWNLASGVYFYRLRAGEFVRTKKIILLQ